MSPLPPRFFPDGPLARLEQAVAADDAPLVARLLAAGVDVNARGRHGVTLLMSAVDRQSARAVHALLAAHADPNLVAADGQGPVVLAARNAQAMPHGAAILQAVLAAGGDPDAREANREPVLMRFVDRQDCAGIAALKSFGADLDILSKNGIPVIMEAALARDWDVVWCLIDLGARYDYGSQSDLWSLPINLDDDVPGQGSIVYPFKLRVWQFLKDRGIAVRPMRN